MQNVDSQQAKTQVRVNSFILSVYNWMAIGLALTGVTSYLVASSPAMLNLIFGNKIIFFGLIIGELALVWYLSARISKLNATTATGLFIFYSVLNGLTLAFIFLAYTGNSIVSTFFICAATFAAISVYGMVTKKDLTSMGSFLFMGLTGLIIAMIVNVFLKNPMMEMVISGIGVLLFVGLTAYDTQKIKNMAISMPADVGESAVRKGAIMGALSLYLDFINLFLFLLRFLGDSD